MTLLTLELSSLNPQPYAFIIKQTLSTLESSYLHIVVFLTPELLPKLNTPAKRAGRSNELQKLISALYIATSTKLDLSCNVIFAVWCGYALDQETWEYTLLSIPECTSPFKMCIDGSITEYCRAITTVYRINSDDYVLK